MVYVVVILGELEYFFFGVDGSGGVSGIVLLLLVNLVVELMVLELFEGVVLIGFGY